MSDRPSDRDEVLLVVPVRLDSRRFPGKALVELNGEAAIEHLLRKLAPLHARLITATDSPQIAQLAERYGEIYLSDEHFLCGSERVAAAYAAMGRGEQWVIDLQGDEIGIPIEAIESVIQARKRSASKILTPCIPMTGSLSSTDRMEKQNDNDGIDCELNTIRSLHKVKVVFDAARRALYFSRSPIPYPFVCDGPWYLHVGVFAYTAASLLAFPSLPPSKLEQRESLEQLRALEAGWHIEMLPLDGWTNRPWPSLNVPSDLAEALAFL
ncbi:MAG: NTP transferase domain-containing protein [Myxococcota bacterium]|jgi:3-deoxy-manno-octulosonate cytidylyltransferase (CMP-KDO synthetase)|nr:NTP transferase domain-containing protein [Myxococcota bacterium]